MGDKRKASEVLLSLEKRVEKVESMVAQIDLNVKSILNKLNIASKATFKDLTYDPRAASMPPPKGIRQPQATPLAGPVVIPTVDDVVTFPQVESTDSKRTSVVEQKVVYSDGRPVILAAVTIAEAAIPTNIIAKKKTDSHGKWHTMLLGGKYVVEVIKGPTAAKRGFKTEYEIEVPGNGKPLTLERKQVE